MERCLRKKRFRNLFDYGFNFLCRSRKSRFVIYRKVEPVIDWCMRFQIRQRIINGVLGISGKEHVYGLLKVSWEKILSDIIPDVRRILKIKIAGIRLFARLFKPCKELDLPGGGTMRVDLWVCGKYQW